MRKYAAVFLSLILVLSLVIIAYAAHNYMRLPYESLLKDIGHYTMMPFPAGGDVRHHIVGHEPYKKWKLWPGKGKMYEGTEPHGALLTVYVNDVALESIKKKKGMTNNAIVLKENYNKDKKLMAITVMYKVEGYNPEGGDWFWVKYDSQFEILKEGKVKGCMDCHGAAKDNDYIFTGKVK